MSGPPRWTEVRVAVPLGWHELVAEALAVGPCTTVALGRTSIGMAPAPAAACPGGCYTLQVGDTRLVVDPSKKGEPGDIVVVWPRKKGPMVTRRLARCAPYNTFYFGSLDTGHTFELPCNKVSAIHAVDGDADLERLAWGARS